MNGRNQKLTVDRLETLLDAYGADLARWPEPLVPEARSLIGRSNEARRLHAEALALDRLLSKASTPEPERLEALAQRIVLAAEQEGLGKPAETDAGRAAGGGARIIPIPLGSRTGEGRNAVAARVTPMPAARPSKGKIFGGSWPAAAALAASLAFGFAIGLSDLAPSSTYSVASLVQPVASDADAVFTDLQFDVLGAVDEDLI